MGATGIGSTKLPIDISKVIGGEVIIADKMQMYIGLDITTNKNQSKDQGGIPRHLTRVIPLIVDGLSVPSFLTILTTTIDLYLYYE
jgi:tRNA A37 N6-isopentenylltransferase MiaA